MHRCSRTLTILGLACALAAGACTMGPANGDVVSSNSVVGASVHYEGYFTAPNTVIRLQVLKQPTLDPAIATNWEDIGTATTSSVAEFFPPSSAPNNPLYKWSANAVPVPPAPSSAQAARWPQGGLVRLRAIRTQGSSDTLLTTFDAITRTECLTGHRDAGETAQQIVVACQGLGKTNVAVVSSKPLPTSTGPLDPNGFLGDKGFDVTGGILTQAYYLVTNAPPLLAAFQLQYGFFGNEVVNAKYYNDGDLGLGRDMTCARLSASGVTQSIACMVTNYDNAPVNVDPELVQNYDPDFDGDPNNAITKLELGKNEFATVAMVYEPALPQNKIKFMVYGADGRLADTAKLDKTHNNVSVPHNCLACHGINSTISVSSSNVTVEHPAFLPFDEFSFKFSTNPQLTRAAQADRFRKLNAMVLKTNPPPATKDLIEGMYAPHSVDDPAAVANNDYVPKNWLSSQSPNGTQLDANTLYRGLVKVGCRTCHVSAITNPALDFLEYSDFAGQIKLIKDEVCGPSKRMPHAERVMKKFWESGARAYLITGFAKDPVQGLARDACAP